MRPVAGNAFCARSRSASAGLPVWLTSSLVAPAALQHPGQPCNFFFHGSAVPSLHQQYGFGLQVIAGMHEVFHSLCHGRSIISSPAGNEAGANDGGHRVARLAHVIKAGQQAARHLGLGQEAHRHFGDHAQQTFAANEGGQQIQPGRVEGPRCPTPAPRLPP